MTGASAGYSRPDGLSLLVTEKAPIGAFSRHSANKVSELDQMLGTGGGRRVVLKRTMMKTDGTRNNADGLILESLF